MKARIEFKELTPNGYETLCFWNIEWTMYTPSIELVSKLQDLIIKWWDKGKIITYNMKFDKNM